jgi:hypothetical protein
MDQRPPTSDQPDGDLEIALTVRRRSDPIGGTIALAGREPVQFTGWMQLTQLLSRALEADG